MRILIFAVISLAGPLLASVPGCDHQTCADDLSSTVAKKDLGISDTKNTSPYAKSNGPNLQPTTVKRADRRAPTPKPCRPSYLFM